ncbi:MAG: HD-GYP domain-containing protein [Chloroflexi bacterium]|nr:HD-GYP domain-containing protein [Chloroflexota bacterium]
MGKLRLPVRLYVLAVIAGAVVAFAATPFMPASGSLDPLLIASFFSVATVANLRVVHVSAKTKITVGGSAVFAAVLVTAPVAAMAIGALSTFIGLRFATKQPLYNRLFNASGTAIAAAVAAWLHRGFSRGPGLLDDPVIIAVSAATYYLVKTGITDIVVALQTRRDPVRMWWPEHRRDVFHHGALYLLGILAAISAERQTWSLALFLVPMALILLALREATRLRQHTKDAIIELADLIDQRDPYTYGHSQRVAEHATRVARHLRMPTERIELITEAARMHDVGKVTTPDHVLKKPGPLNAYEWDEMHKHCDAGHHFLQRIPDFVDGADLVLSHHERVDGSGYPRGLRGVDLPLEASIIAVCDAFDAMTSDRVYRSALPHHRVIAELQTGRGTQWHENAVDALLELMEQGAIVPASGRAPEQQVAAAG